MPNGRKVAACHNPEKTKRDKTVASSTRKRSKVAACHNPKTKTGVKTVASTTRYEVRRSQRWQPTEPSKANGGWPVCHAKPCQGCAQCRYTLYAAQWQGTHGSHNVNCMEKSQTHLAYRAPCALGWQVGAGLLAVRCSDTSYVPATGSAHIMSAKVDEVGALRGVRLRKHTIRKRASTCSNRYSQSSIEGTHGAAIAAHNVVARLGRLGPSTRTCAAIGTLVESLAVH